MEGSFPFIAFMDPNIVVTPADIELSEVASTFEMVNEVVNEGEQVSILPSDKIECTIVLNEPELPILLLHKEDRGTYRELGLLDVPCPQSFGEERIQFTLLL